MQSTSTAKSFGFFPQSGVYAVSDPNLKSPQVHTWNLSIQREVGKWLLSASYLGNHTAHLWSSRELNLQRYIPGNCLKGEYGLTANGPCSSNSATNTAARRLFTILNPTWGPYYSTVAYLDAGVPMIEKGRDLERFRAACPQLVVAKTFGAGHFSPLEVPDQINAMIARFIAVGIDRRPS